MRNEGAALEASDRAKEFARAVAPVAEAMGVPVPEIIAAEAPEIMEDLPPDEMAARVADLMKSKDGRHGLFVRNSAIIAWDEEAEDFAEMKPTRLRTWLPRMRGVVFVRKRVPQKDNEGNNTGRFMTIKGALNRDLAQCVLDSDVLKTSLPKITAFHPVRLPVIQDGEMKLLKAGYDQASGIYTHSGIEFDENLPFEDGAHHLYRCFRTYGWRNEGRDMAIHLAAMLSVFCRGLYTGKAPAFAYVANIQSSGKTTLAWCGPWAVFGRRKTLPLLQDQDARLQETLNSLALAGVGSTVFDNINWGNAEVKSELLDQWISNEEWDFRKLQGNVMLSPKLTGVTFMTGNNIKLSTDLQRRTLICDLWNPLAAADRPRDASMLLMDSAFFESKEQRAMMLASMWAVVKEWDRSGRVAWGRELDSFEVWSRVVPGIVKHAGAVFGRVWDCMAENTNENVGDKSSRDYKRLAEVAMTEFGRDEHGAMRDTFEVTVQQLAGVARRHAIEECQFALYPEKDIESVLDTEHKANGWRYEEPKSFVLGDEAAEGERRRQAAQWLTPTSRSKFGNAVKAALNERHFKVGDAALFMWLHRAGVTPARYAVTLVKAKA